MEQTTLNHLVIEGCPPWDGSYELPDFSFTNRELHRIKTISGIRGGELVDALASEDAAVFVALATVVVERTGQRLDPDDFWDTQRTSIRLELGGGEGPPAQSPSEDETPESNASSGTFSESGGE